MFTSASDGGNYLGLNVDGTTMILSNKQLKGNYKVTAPLTLTGSTIGLNYDTDAF